MIFSRKIHGIQKALVNLSNTLLLSLLPRVFYSMQIRLNGKIWKSDEKLTHHSADKVFLHKSVCSSNSPSICCSSVQRTVLQSILPSVRLSICPSARPSVCPSVDLPVRHTFKFIESYDKLWITPTSLWLKNAPVLDKKKSFVTLIGCKAKSSQRHRMWGMNENLSDNCSINDWMAEITTKGQE